jgi:hypothetical protein
MKPDIPLVLQDHAKRLMESFAPKLEGFDANGAAMMSFMLAMTAEEWDRAASRRVEENEAIRAIFRDAAPRIANHQLAVRLEALAATDDRDLRISALDTSNTALREALAELHAHVEASDNDDFRAINEAIWAELKRSVERRQLSHANF